MEQLTYDMANLSKIDISNIQYLSNIYNKVLRETKSYQLYDNYHSRYDIIYIYPSWLYSLDINTQKKIKFAI